MINGKYVLLVILARGGSKGVPRKNLQHVGGMSLVGRAVQTSLHAALIDQVVVSSDDNDILEEARYFGAKAVPRDPEFCDDGASSDDALRAAVIDCLDRGAVRPDVVVMMQCTAPFTTAEDIDRTVRPVINGETEACFAVTEFPHFVLAYNAKGRLYIVNHGETKRRQELSPQYLLAGSVYAITYRRLLDEGLSLTGDCEVCVVPEDHVLDIDTEEDLRRARKIAAERGLTYPL